MKYHRYQHVEYLDTDVVDGIEIGNVWVFPKIDGANCQVYLNDEGQLEAGSRNRVLSLEDDHHGFFSYVLAHSQNFRGYFEEFPNHRLYGEWLFPHTIQTYRADAWDEFYVFDVTYEDENECEYLPYDVYSPLLEKYNIKEIIPICTMTNGSLEYFMKALEKNNFLIEDGLGIGEGIVIKNYGYINKYGRKIWAKIVRNEFKEKHYKIMGIPNINTELTIEERILSDFCSEHFISKEYSKLLNSKGSWDRTYIPELLGRIFYELISEECWNIVKKYKEPTVNFKLLHRLVNDKIKTTLPELFTKG